jgi:hypothetical protein
MARKKGLPDSATTSIEHGHEALFAPCFADDFVPGAEANWPAATQAAGQNHQHP